MFRTAIFISSLAILAGCAPSSERPIGMANPASVYCQEKGGQVQIVDGPGGQVGMCVFPNGQAVEEWELYRREHPEIRS